MWHQKMHVRQETSYYEPWPYGCCTQRFCAFVTTCVVASVTGSELCGRDSVHAHAQLSLVYLMSTLDVTRDKMYQALPFFIVGRAWERGCYSTVLTQTYAPPFCRLDLAKSMGGGGLIIE